MLNSSFILSSSSLHNRNSPAHLNVNQKPFSANNAPRGFMLASSTAATTSQPTDQRVGGCINRCRGGMSTWIVAWPSLRLDTPQCTPGDVEHCKGFTNPMFLEPDTTDTCSRFATCLWVKSRQSAGQGDGQRRVIKFQVRVIR